MKEHEFDSYADSYAGVVKKATNFIPMQDDFYLHAKIEMLSLSIEKLPAGARILDFGSGVGGLSIPLSKLHPDKKFYAFDPSAESLHKIEQLKLPNMNCISDEDIFSSAEWKSSFDYIFCINVFHHIEKSLRMEKVSILKKILKPGGKLLILEHNPLNPLTQLVVKRCELDRGVKLLGSRELHSLFSQNSIRIMNHWYVLFFPIHNKIITKIEARISFLPLGAQQCIEGVVT